jgi:hypothetical protein
MIVGRQGVRWTTLFYAYNFFQKQWVTERLYLIVSELRTEELINVISDAMILLTLV